MHVLITTDTVGGVWTYTRELVTGLINRGTRVTLVSFGALPKPGQTDWMNSLIGLDYRPTDYRLEWMEVAQRDVEESRSFVEMVIREVRPDVLHLNQYCYGGVASGIPRIVVAHSDVVSWWVDVHGCEPDVSPWMRWYRDTVIDGLNRADVVVAPSQWMLDQIRTYYTRPSFGRVIYNGRDPRMFSANVAKENCVLSVGRVWDEGKQISLLLDSELPVPTYIAGSLDHPARGVEDSRIAGSTKIHVLGEQTPEQLQHLFATAAIYAATSRYEPFGLAPVEAALSRCALVANDTPTFRELWGDAASYFRRNDARDLANVIGTLAADPKFREQRGEDAYAAATRKFSAEKMVEQYEALYQTVASPARVA